MNTTNHSILPLQFYVAESCLEVFARHMLFLTLLFEPTDKLGLQGMYVGYWKISYYTCICSCYYCTVTPRDDRMSHMQSMALKSAQWKK